MKNEVTITIIDNRNKGVGRWMRFTSSVLLLVFAPIWVGAIIQSTAMQWAAFIIGFFFLIAIANKLISTAKSGDMTIAEAREHLDLLEKGGNQ